MNSRESSSGGDPANHAAEGFGLQAPASCRGSTNRTARELSPCPPHLRPGTHINSPGWPRSWGAASRRGRGQGGGGWGRPCRTGSPRLSPRAPPSAPVLTGGQPIQPHNPPSSAAPLPAAAGHAQQSQAQGLRRHPASPGSAEPTTASATTPGPPLPPPAVLRWLARVVTALPLPIAPSPAPTHAHGHHLEHDLSPRCAFAYSSCRNGRRNIHSSMHHSRRGGSARGWRGAPPGEVKGTSQKKTFPRPPCRRFSLAPAQKTCPTRPGIPRDFAHTNPQAPDDARALHKKSGRRRLYSAGALSRGRGPAHPSTGRRSAGGF